MNRFACLLVIALSSGCASRSAIPVATATTMPAEHAAATPPAAQVVELRHFYLLSPGPSATLVVTRSDRSDLVAGDR
jgi:hypothetical protein